MFCSNCGEKFIEPNQKFCQKCGHTVETAMTTSQTGSQVTIMNTQASSQIPQKSVGYPQKPLMMGKIGPHSKRSLAFGITALGFCAFGGLLSILSTIPVLYFGPYIFDFIYMINVLSITRIPVYVAALVFSILARSNGNKAAKYESRNKMQKAGKVMGLLGVIFSALIIGSYLISLLISLINYLLTFLPGNIYIPY